jgi:hypothetical protein
VESSTGSALQPRIELRELAGEILGEADLSGRLAGALVDATRGVESALAPQIALEAVPRIDRRRSRAVVAAICLLEAADRAEASVHGLAEAAPEGAGETNGKPAGPRFTPTGGSPQGDTAAGLAAAWLRARSAELAGGLGAAALREQAQASSRIAEGWRREAQNLYDAARSPERCLETVEQRGGALCALAACLDAIGEGRAERIQPLHRFGAALGTAAMIRDDVAALTVNPAGALHPLQRGVYSLPVAYAVEANPKLASRIGGAVAEDAVAGIVAEVVEAGGVERCGQEVARLADDARTALDGLDETEGLVALADAVATPSEVTT